MTNKFFNAVTKGKQIGDGTVGDLVDWLEKYINILFPENGIEYWADQRFGTDNSLQRFHPVPNASCDDEGIHHVACYARQGGCEGRLIQISLYLRNGTYKSLSWIKTFGNADETWMIVRAIEDVLSTLFFLHESPEIVDMAFKLPRQQTWYRETSLTEEVTLAVSPYALSVTTPSGLVFDNRNWVSEGNNAKFHVEARVTDWVTVLTNLKATFKQVKEGRIAVPYLPGYIISDRGVEDISGYYVLPPDCNPLDDRLYLGYFPTGELAIEAACQHLSQKQAA